MNNNIELMMAKYNVNNLYDRKNAMKEIIQEIVLCGLSRSGFFDKAAFYGGTALRIFYGLDRFSEDLDFSLISPDADFALSDYLPTLEKEVNSFGLNMQITIKEKTADSDIQSAFVKGNTQEHLLLFFDSDSNDKVPSNEVVKIKFEVDTDPPQFASFENKYRLLPSPYSVRLYDMPSLFAGKLHAVLARSWQNRVKGRDLYDYVFYITNGTAVNLEHLKARLVDSGHLSHSDSFNSDDLKHMLCDKFDSIDYTQAKNDVIPFIHDKACLDIWSADFFKQITGMIHSK